MAEARRPPSSDRIAPMAADPNPYSKFPYPRRPWFELGLGFRWEVLVGGGCVGCAKGTYD